MALKLARHALALLLALGMAPPAQAEDDFLDHYKAGLAALGRQEWSIAAARLRQALAGKGDEDARLARRFYLKRYLPHYQLGRALFEAGDCAGALAAWEESARQGVVRQFEEYRLLSRDREVCIGRQAAAAEVAAALSDARQRVAAAAAAAQRVAEVRADPEMTAAWARGEPSLESREHDALELLASAQRQLPAEPGAADLPRLRDASALAAQALTRFEELERQSREARSAAIAEQTGQRSGLEGQLKVAAALLDSHRALEPYPTEVARRRSELEAAMAAARALPSTADATELSAVSLALLAAHNRLKKAIAPPPDALSRAAEAYFQGEYQAALDLLLNTELQDQRAAAHVALFRAAARFGLWAASGERDEALLAAARADLRACRAADPKRIPTTTAFSPRFVELFTRESSLAPP